MGNKRERARRSFNSHRTKSARERTARLRLGQQLWKEKQELRKKHIEEQGLDPTDPNLQEIPIVFKEEPLDQHIPQELPQDPEPVEFEPYSYKPTNIYEYEWKIHLLEKTLEVLSNWVLANGLIIPPDLYTSLEDDFGRELQGIQSQSWQEVNVTMDQPNDELIQINGGVDAAQIFPNFPFQSDLEQSDRKAKQKTAKDKPAILKQPSQTKRKSKIGRKGSKKGRRPKTPPPIPPRVPHSPIKQTKLPNGKVICEKCQMIFSSRGIIVHMTVIHPDPNIPLYKCSKCSRGYKEKWKLNIHVKRCVLNEPQIVYPCTECGTSYKGKASFKRHQKEVHSPEGQRLIEKVPCPKCSRPFMRRNLGKHIKTVHFEPREYLVCPVEGCGKKFKQKKYLKYHMEIHEAKDKGSRDFCCTHCGKTFQTRNCLSAHTRMSHAKEVNHAFKCPFEGCGLGFSVEKYFEDHQTTHDPNYRPQEKEIICELCGEMYATRPQLNRHVQKVHQQKEKISQDLEIAQL